MIKDAAYAVIGSTWVPLANAGTVDLSYEDSSVISSSLTGKRKVLVPSGHEHLRTWTVQCSDVPQRWADAHAFIRQLAKDKTVFEWVSPLAKHSNALRSSWSGTTGALQSNGFVTGLSSGSAIRSGVAPVKPGETYTFSVYGSEPPQYAVFSDDAGATKSPIVYMTAVPGEPMRYAGTAVAPVGATQIRLWLRQQGDWFNPALTWGSQLRPYGEPGGCQRAIISDVSQSHGVFHRSNGRISYSFTVQEVS